ncbi:hypothetical protein [Corynebacterium kalidii]
MALTMTAAQRTHTDKALSGLENALITVIDHIESSPERDQLTAELNEVRSQRQSLGDTHPNQAYRWTTAATTRTKKLRRKHAQVLSSKTRKTRAASARAQHAPTVMSETHGGLHSWLPYTEEHRQLIRDTTELLLSRKNTLQRSARVTTGRLHSAIVDEIQRVDQDLHALTTMSHRKATACHSHHQQAAEQWKEQGAEALANHTLTKV